MKTLLKETKTTPQTGKETYEEEESAESFRAEGEPWTEDEDDWEDEYDYDDFVPDPDE